jgi:hypothetical protein
MYRSRLRSATVDLRNNRPNYVASQTSHLPDPGHVTGQTQRSSASPFQYLIPHLRENLKTCSDVIIKCICNLCPDVAKNECFSVRNTLSMEQSCVVVSDSMWTSNWNTLVHNVNSQLLFLKFFLCVNLLHCICDTCGGE